MKALSSLEFFLTSKWKLNAVFNQLLKVENGQSIDRSMRGRKDITKIEQVTSKRPHFLVNLLLMQPLSEKGLFLFLCVCVHKCMRYVCR